LKKKPTPVWWNYSWLVGHLLGDAGTVSLKEKHKIGAVIICNKAYWNYKN
jgi:hypothetical protein